MAGVDWTYITKAVFLQAQHQLLNVKNLGQEAVHPNTMRL
jgi:hypothetical protein